MFRRTPTCSCVTSRRGWQRWRSWGPSPRAVGAALPDDFSNAAFPFGTSREIDLGYARVRASRMTFVGELGWELYVPTDFAAHVFDTILEVGRISG